MNNAGKDKTADSSTACGSVEKAPKVKKVFPLYDYWLILFFANGEVRLYDCLWTLRLSSMKKLHKMSFFGKVRVARDGVKWSKNIALGSKELYADSTPLTDYDGNLLKLL